MNIRNKRKQPLVAGSLIVLGLVLAAAAILLLAGEHGTEPQSPANSPHSSNAPSSKKPSPSAINNYSVASDLPKYISIPAINVPKTRIIQLGLLKGNEIATPDNIYDTGWYNGSSKPGQNGAMFIYGHVSSWTADGVFYNLKKLQPGDKVYITRGDNKHFTYQVGSSKIYNYKHVDMKQALSPVDAGTPGLNLMTCTGKIIKGTSEFNERLVVFAKQI